MRGDGETKKCYQWYVSKSPPLVRVGGMAIKVGARHGKSVVLEIDAAGMHVSGHQFFISENGVWLTEHVPPRFLKRIELGH